MILTSEEIRSRLGRHVTELDVLGVLVAKERAAGMHPEQICELFDLTSAQFEVITNDARAMSVYWMLIALKATLYAEACLGKPKSEWLH